MSPEKVLAGRVAIVTGGSRGMGLAMAIGLAEAGAKVVIAATHREELEAAAVKIDGIAGRGATLPIQCDVANAAQCQRVVRRAVRHFGHVDMLVNNAAKGQVHVEASSRTKSLSFWESDPDVWQQVIATNVNGSYLMAYYATPHMVNRGWGRIVNITTSIATMQRRQNSPYGVAKAALETMTLIWAQDLATTGVTVNSLLPGGATDTRFLSPKIRDSLRQSGGEILDPTIMVRPILWLASTDSDEVTGARFVARLWRAGIPAQQAARAAEEKPALRQPEPQTQLGGRN